MRGFLCNSKTNPHFREACYKPSETGNRQRNITQKLCICRLKFEVYGCSAISIRIYVHTPSCWSILGVRWLCRWFLLKTGLKFRSRYRQWSLSAQIRFQDWVNKNKFDEACFPFYNQKIVCWKIFQLTHRFELLVSTWTTVPTRCSYSDCWRCHVTLQTTGRLMKSLE